MSSCIHHGPPGSYKTFTLVQRVAIPALKDGRCLITNIRDFDSLDKIKAAFPQDSFSDQAQLIHIPESEDGRAEIARFFHWAPPGALILIDEGQRVFPKRRDFKLESLDQYKAKPGQVIAVLNDKHGNPMKRPEDIFTAFDMQRHWNWDIYVSTPNIDKLHDFIRQVSEWAYRHRDVSGVLPWFKGTWYEHQHDPEQSGKSASHVVGKPVRYKVDTRVYQCYSSTATGSHIESRAGRSIFSDPKIRTIGVVISLLLCFMGWNFTRYMSSKEDRSGVVVAAAAELDADRGLSSSEHGSASGLEVRDVDEKVFSLIERSGQQLKFLVVEGDRRYEVRDYVLIKQGYAVVSHGDCAVYLYEHGQAIDASCDRITCKVQVFSPERVLRRECEAESLNPYMAAVRGAPKASDNERAKGAPHRGT